MGRRQVEPPPGNQTPVLGDEREIRYERKWLIVEKRRYEENIFL